MRVLEVNNNDLQGRRFNGYDLIDNQNDIDVNQIVIEKDSTNPKVFKFFSNIKEYYVYSKFFRYETENSLQGIFSITSPILINSEIYKNSDIIHFHLIHNSKLSLYSIFKISTEKKIVISLHDPWLLTGRCVHFYECEKWKNGCQHCSNLNSYFNFKIDNCSTMWNLKNNLIENMNTRYIISSKWMQQLLIQRNLKNYDLIPFGIDTDKFNIDKFPNSRQRFGIGNEIVLFFRSHNCFKGTDYIIDALDKYLKSDNITIITCGEKGLLDNLKERYKIIELGIINNEELAYAYSACDIFLMPSVAESFGMMAIEAMSFSKPVIIFDNTALPSVTFAPECGYLVENKNSKKLADAIDYLIEHKEERIRRGELGRSIVLNNYKIENYNEKIFNLYAEVNESNSIKSCDDIIASSDDNLLFSLNKLTISLFGKKSSVTKKLLFNCKEDSSKIDYDNLRVQETIYQYCNKIYDILKVNDIKIPIKYKIKWLIDNVKKFRRIYKEKRLWQK